MELWSSIIAVIDSDKVKAILPRSHYNTLTFHLIVQQGKYSDHQWPMALLFFYFRSRIHASTLLGDVWWNRLQAKNGSSIRGPIGNKTTTFMCAPTQIRQLPHPITVHHPYMWPFPLNLHPMKVNCSQQTKIHIQHFTSILFCSEINVGKGKRAI